MFWFLLLNIFFNTTVSQRNSFSFMIPFMGMTYEIDSGIIYFYKSVFYENNKNILLRVLLTYKGKLFSYSFKNRKKFNFCIYSDRYWNDNINSHSKIID